MLAALTVVAAAAAAAAASAAEAPSVALVVVVVDAVDVIDVVAVAVDDDADDDEAADDELIACARFAVGCVGCACAYSRRLSASIADRCSSPPSPTRTRVCSGWPRLSATRARR